MSVAAPKVPIKSLCAPVVCLALLLCLLAEPLARAAHPLFQYFDEAVQVLLLCYLCFSVATSKVHKSEVALFVSFLFLLGLSLVFGKSPSSNDTIIQTLIHFKFFIFFASMIRIFDTEERIRTLARFFHISAAVMVAGFLANVAFGEAFLDYFQVPGQERGGISRVLGLPLKPNDLSIFVAAYLIYVLNAQQRSLAFSIIAIAIALAISLMNGSRVGLAGVVVGLTLLLRGRYFVLGAAITAMCLVASVFLYGDYLAYAVTETERNISELSRINESQYIRGIMIFYGAKLALMNFPFGTGAATFGSVLSKDSPVYAELGLSSLRFFQDMEGVYDSNLATVLGEFGLIGIISFYYLYVAMISNLRKRGATEAPILRTSALFALVFITNPLLMYQFNSIIFATTLILIMSKTPGFREGQCRS